MNSRTALVAHPYPLVVDALAALVAGAGYVVTRASDQASVATALTASPDLALVAANLDGAAVAKARNGTMRTLVIDDTGSDIALTAPVERVAATIAALGIVPGAAPALTPRETDVARLVAAGQRNRTIAATLGISEGTVKMHLHNVYAKLGLESRTQLAMSVKALGAV